jgi:hypothetical protein
MNNYQTAIEDHDGLNSICTWSNHQFRGHNRKAKGN